MQKTISKFIYYFLASILVVVGFIVKYFLVDTNLGARFNNFNHRLLASDIIFLYALFLGIIGLIFYAIRKSERSTLKDSTIIISALLLLPISFVLALTPILETIYPGKVGDTAFASFVMGITVIGTFSFFGWIIIFIIILIKQALRILITKR